MTFKQELEILRKAKRQSKLSDLTLYEERWGMLDRVKVLPSAANTEKHICEFLQLRGHHAAKVATQGTFKAAKVEETALGRLQTSKGIYLPSGGRKGAADISAVIFGVSVHIELKYSKGDKQSVHQRKFETDVNQAGGIYMVVHNVDNFYQKYYELLEHPTINLMKSYLENNGG
jgi:hypothetical protein